jgi:hypothetical protein
MEIIVILLLTGFVFGWGAGLFYAVHMFERDRKR